MADIEHNAIADPQIHEPKGVVAAANGDILSKVGGVSAWVLPSSLSGVAKAPQFVQTADQIVANTVTETTILGTGVGTLTIPANVLKVGSLISCKVEGIVSDTANPSLRIRAKIGGVIIVDSGAVVLGGTANDHFALDVQMVVRAIGATGKLMSTGGAVTSKNDHFALVRAGASPDELTIDTTTSLLMDMTVEWGTANAGNTITGQICILRVD